MDQNALWLKDTAWTGDTAHLREGVGEKQRTGSHVHITSSVALSETMNLTYMMGSSKPSALRSFLGHMGTWKGWRERSFSHSFLQQMFPDHCSVPGMVLGALSLST